MKAAIVGSGISACACAVRLKEKGVDFTVFEKECIPGGKLTTERIDDFIIEGGPDSFLPENASLRFLGSKNIATRSGVREITRRAGGYGLVTGSERMIFDAVVLTTPSYATAEMVRPMDPKLADQLSSVEWSSTATISLAFKKKDVPQDLPGFGFIVPRIEKRRINAATWSSVKWSFRAPSDAILVRCFVGGGHDEELVSYDDGDLVRLVLEELRSIAGIRARPIISKIYRWMKSMPRYTVGHIGRVAAIDETLQAYPGLYLAGSSYRGIGIGDCVKSGFDAAEEIDRLRRN